MLNLSLGQAKGGPYTALGPLKGPFQGPYKALSRALYSPTKGLIQPFNGEISRNFLGKFGGKLMPGAAGGGPLGLGNRGAGSKEPQRRARRKAL